MKAFTIRNYSPGRLICEDVAPPAPPARSQVQLRLLGTSLNPIDRLISGGYGAPLFNRSGSFPVVLGRDAVAEVVSVGTGVRDLEVGQRVIVAASPRTGSTYAELFNLPRRCIAPIKDDVPNHLAAGIGYAGLTALQALTAAGITPKTALGKRVCINGASGGVGSIALLFASQWGAMVTGVSSKKNHSWLKKLGAYEVVDYCNRAAMKDIRADIVLNCATPSDDDHGVDNPLLHLPRSSPYSYRSYVTTVTPLLKNVTRKGPVRGLAVSSAALVKISITQSFHGVRYRWVLFKEDPDQLALVAKAFAEPGVPDIVGSTSSLLDLPRRFNAARATHSRGKSVFLAEEYLCKGAL